MIVQWEHLAISLEEMNYAEKTAKLNELGRDGWELVTITQRPSAYLKRKKYADMNTMRNLLEQGNCKHTDPERATLAVCEHCVREAAGDNV